MSNKIELYKKIAEVQKSVNYIQKKGRNQAQNYAYVRERDIVKTIKNPSIKKRPWAQTGFPCCLQTQAGRHPVHGQR